MSGSLLLDLQNEIKTGKVVCIVGPAVARTMLALAAGSGPDVTTLGGLLESGIDRCIQLGKLTSLQADRKRQDLASGDLDELHSVANLVSRKLGAPGGEFKRWLRETFEPLKVARREIVQALQALDVLLATTNYDGLLEEGTGLQPVTWLDPAQVERVMRGNLQAILHLRGHYQQPESIAWGTLHDENMGKHEQATAALRALRTNCTLLYVGYDDGISDPKLVDLLRWAREVFSGSEYRHYRLVPENLVEAARAQHTPEDRIFVLSYPGADGGLLELLTQLKPQSLTAAAIIEQRAESARQEALRFYRDRVAAEYMYAEHRGVFGVNREQQPTSLLRDEVYVVPKLMPEAEHSAHRAQEQQLLLALEAADLGCEERERLEEEYAILTGEHWQPGKKATKRPREGMALGEVLQRHRHLVIIGGPGSGKSALTRFLARRFAQGGQPMLDTLGWSEECTPISISLAAFADSRCKDDRRLPLMDFLRERLTRRGEEILPESLGAQGGELLWAAIKEAIEKGQAFVLLDGVDEVPDSAQRTAIVREVDQFLLDHPKARCLVTSRPYGYVGLSGGIAHFYVPHLSPKEVQEFVFRWQVACEKARHPAAPDLASAQDEANSMLAELRENPKVAALATNPLMLVIFALIRHQHTRLPEQRVQLYNTAVNTLVDTWNRLRSLDNIDVGGMQLPPERLIPVLAELAEWTRREKPTGVIHRAELKRKLVEILEKRGLDEEEPAKTAESYIKAAVDRAGLMEERGTDIFAFWHPTFEEFLAAVELTNPPDRAIERILPLRDDPRWHEVILLAVGYLGVTQKYPQIANQMVEAIAERDPGPLEPIAYPHLRLAVACMLDDVGVTTPLADRLIRRLATAVRLLPASQLNGLFVRTARSRPQLKPGDETVAELVQLASHADWEVRMMVAQRLGTVARMNQAARGACERLLQDSDRDVSCQAALGLLRAGEFGPPIWQAFEESEFSFELGLDVETVAKEIRGIPSALEALKAQLASEDPKQRLRSAKYLAAAKGEKQEIIRALAPLQESGDLQIRRAAMVLLNDMGMQPSKTETLALFVASGGTAPINLLRPHLDALDALLSHSDPQVSFRAAVVLARESADPNLRSRSIDRLSAELVRAEPEKNEAEAALQLLRIGIITPHAINALTGEGRAISILRRNLPDTPRHVLLSALKSQCTSDTPTESYLKAFAIIASLGEADEALIQDLKSRMEEAAPSVRVSIASQLDRAHALDSNVLTLLRPCLAHEDPDVRLRAAVLLFKHGEADSELRQALHACLAEESFGNRYRAAYLLYEMGDLNRRVAEALTAPEFPYHRFPSQALNEDIVLTTIIERIGLEAPEYLHSYKQALTTKHLDRTKVEILAQLLHCKPEDNAAVRDARELLASHLISAVDGDEEEEEED